MPPSHLDHYAFPQIPSARLEPPRRAADPSVGASNGLAIAVHHDPLPALVVEVSGELDTLTAPRLLDVLGVALRERCPILIVDLTEVTFLGSAGLAVLAGTHKHASPHTALRIVARLRATLRPLQLTGLATMLQLYPSRADALTPQPT